MDILFKKKIEKLADFKNLQAFLTSSRTDSNRYRGHEDSLVAGVNMVYTQIHVPSWRMNTLDDHSYRSNG